LMRASPIVKLAQSCTIAKKHIESEVKAHTQCIAYT
jgi:hypothetical protein